MIKNATFFRLTTALAEPDALAALLAPLAFRPTGGLEMESVGFVPPADGLSLVHRVAGMTIGRLRVDKKTIPASAIKQQTKERAEAIERNQGYKPGRKQMREIKEMVRDHLLPTAIPATSFIDFYAWDDVMAVATTSQKGCDRVIEALAKVLEPFPLAPVHTCNSPGATMTEWLVSDDPFGAFTIDNMAEMKAAGESRASVYWKNEMIDVEHAREHFEQGKSVSRMALTHADRVSFVLNNQGVLSGITLLDVISEEAVDKDDFDSMAALYGQEIHGLYHALIEAWGGFYERA